MVKFKNGKAVEHWEFMQPSGYDENDGTAQKDGDE